MKPQHPWLGQSPDIVSGVHHRKIGPARLLFDFYTAKQTDADGRVYYGRTMTYDWIRSQIPECPTKRTLRRYNRRLRRGGYIRTRTVVQNRENIGLTVTIMNQTKFRTALKRITGEQQRLFNQPLRLPPVQKLVENKKIWPQGVETNPSSGGVKSGPEKAVLRKKPETYTSNTRAQNPRVVPSSNADWQKQRSWRQEQKRKRLLAEIYRVHEIYRGAQDPAVLAQRDQKLDALYERLQQTGWQDERAG